MKIFQKYSVAWAIAIVVAISSVAFGVLTAGSGVLPVKSGKWVYDGADILNDATETAVQEYNTGLDKDYNAYVAVATVDTLKDVDVNAYAAKLFSKWGLYGNDFLLLLDKEGKESYLYHGSNYQDFDYSAYLDGFVNPNVTAGNYDAAVTQLLPGIQSYLAQIHGTEGMDAPAETPSGDAASSGASDTSAPAASSGGASSAPAASSATNPDGQKQDHQAPETKKVNPWIYVAVIAVLVVILVVVLAALDRSRYRSWYRRYGAMQTPEVDFHPILLWHRSGSAWAHKCAKGIRPVAGSAHRSSNGGRR